MPWTSPGILGVKLRSHRSVLTFLLKLTRSHTWNELLRGSCAAVSHWLQALWIDTLLTVWGCRTGNCGTVKFGRKIQSQEIKIIFSAVVRQFFYGSFLFFWFLSFCFYLFRCYVFTLSFCFSLFFPCSILFFLPFLSASFL